MNEYSYHCPQLLFKAQELKTRMPRKAAASKVPKAQKQPARPSKGKKHEDNPAPVTMGHKPTPGPDTTNAEEDNSECPICCEICLPPILQCRNGHVICNSCKARITTCPVCCNGDIHIRNLIAEKAVKRMFLPCTHASFGCKQKIQLEGKEEHEQQCQFRPFTCPVDKCTQELRKSQCVAHLVGQHGAGAVKKPIFTFSYEYQKYACITSKAFLPWCPIPLKLLRQSFLIMVENKGEKGLHAWVAMVSGDQKEAAKYIYEVEASSGHFGYSFSGTVSSLRTSASELIHQRHCLSLDMVQLHELKKEGKISFQVEVKKCEHGGS